MTSEKRNKMWSAGKKIYEKIIEEATVDCCGEYEPIQGWACLLDEKIHTPCNCSICAQKAVLSKIDTDENGMVIIGVIKLNNTQVRVLIQDVLLEGKKMDYIRAYGYWCKEG